jgi:hypothetical protein
MMSAAALSVLTLEPVLNWIALHLPFLSTR